MGLQRVGHNWATFTFQILCRCSVTKLCPTRQPRGQQHVRFPVLHCLLQFAQTHVHWFSDAIQTSYPLLALSLPALNHSQHQGPFQWAGSSYHVVKVLDPQLQHQSFRWIFRVDFLWDWLVWSIALLSKRLQESSPALQFESFSSLALCLLYGPSFTYMYDYWKNRRLTTGKIIGLTIQTFVSKVMSLLLNTVSVCHSFPSKEQVS